MSGHIDGLTRAALLAAAEDIDCSDEILFGDLATDQAVIQWLWDRAKATGGDA